MVRCVSGPDPLVPPPPPLSVLPDPPPDRQHPMAQPALEPPRLEAPNPGGAPGPGHNIVRWGQAEYCTRCGRTTEAKQAGRAQQWRRLCQPLPSYVAKVQKGHKLMYIGSWQCSQCPCSADRLYRTRCTGKSESFRPKPSILSGPEAPLTPQPQAAALCVVQGQAEPRHTGQSRTVRAPVQSQLERFFPDTKRPRRGTAEQGLDRGASRSKADAYVCRSVQDTDHAAVSGQGPRSGPAAIPWDFHLPEARRRRLAVEGHRTLPQATGSPPG